MPTSAHILKALEKRLKGHTSRDIADIYYDYDIKRGMNDIDQGLKDIQGQIDDLHYPRTHIVQIGENVKCPYCGQYGIPHSQCEHCGAPIDEH